MKLTTLQSNLEDALALACRAVPGRTTLPVLHNVLLEAGDGTLVISGTDLDLGVRVPCTARVEVDGGCTVPAKRFSDLVATLPPEQVRLALEDHRLLLDCGSVRATFPTIAAEEYPVMAEGGGEIEVEGAALRAALDHVTFAASTDAERPVLTGVLMEFDDDELYLAAADGFRLARTRIPASAEPDRLIVPATVLALAGHLGDGPVRIGYRRTNSGIITGVTFDDGETLVEGSLIDGSFPDVERIVPPAFETRVLVGREQLKDAVRRAMIFARDAANIVTLEIPALGNPARMDVSGDEGESSGRSTVPMTMDGDELMIALNGRFLLDALGAAATAEVRLSFNGATKPVAVEEVEGDDAWVHVIMPMALEARRSAHSGA